MSEERRLQKMTEWAGLFLEPADAVWPTVLLGARFSPAQLAVIHRAAQIQRVARRTES